MTSALRAGAAYAALVFAAGFALGAVRVGVLVPRLGELAAVALELPVMLGLSWIACGWILRRLPVAPAPAPRLVMGAAAFATLMALELALVVGVFREPAGGLVAGWAEPAGALGLAGQIAFAAFPLIRRGQPTT